ncbi:MAG: ATP-binding cassette domain-containing protein [Saprospiraceae bacterium]|nr:ATP-binding cassette domain-containing protein [Saprospiraceae bacterium]
MIEIKKLTKNYGSKQVLDNIELLFIKGNVYGIVGENGAGKTTLFRCMAGIELYDGKIMYKNGQLKKVLGYLPTDLFFFPKMTAREYLQLLCNARQVTAPNFDEVNIFDLPLDQYADTYSTGMKKKLALNALLLQKNDVFILDEPFNGVDIHSNILIKELIVKLKRLNKIVIISSHIFSTLNDTCDYLHLLKNGAIHKSVDKAHFSSIEEDMKSSNILNKIDKLNIL